ncbi:protein TASOR-like isoform X2 [Echeneis naucrates]|uniref:protein TASOR-like isoform X2 n=1 Tax=Echeneis naucrates TaxID=173247 RepID=UPI001113FC13|nr:protein TASOR-like isoform X2 [Echeneis naucrates]
MDDSLVRREAARPRRLSAAAEPTANVSWQDGEVIEIQAPREPPNGQDRPAAAQPRMERRNSATQGVYQRHMPMEPNKFHIPRKAKENRALFQYVSTESREFEDMMSILTSSYIDTGSASCFTYSKPRLVHSELLEKEFVEKRKELKTDGRTDKELEESYGFLLADAVKLPMLCEKGLYVSHTRITLLGNPTKGVYLSRYSDILQVNALTPGTTGEIIIFKVMKGKIKSIYENMKNLLDPTPRFDSHVSKNFSKVTSLNSYRAFELTQHYFYEYSFDELRQRPRQVCPYAVISFQFIGKDTPLPSKPLAPLRLNSQSAEGSKERAQYTVWSGDLVKGDQVLLQISLRSFSPPLLPHRLPEKLKIGCLMRLDQLTKRLPADLLSYNLYDSSQEVVKNGYYCSLLEVVDRNRSTTSVTKLLNELEIKRMVLVFPLTERGFLFLLSSVQMATPSERKKNWSRSLQALFVFPETRDVAKSRSAQQASESLTSVTAVMPHLGHFIPALHHALVKARANPPAELSAGVERQAQEYLSGLNDGKVRQYPMGEYDSKQDEQKTFPAPTHHRLNREGYLRSYLYKPAVYLLSVARARQLMEVYSVPEEPQVKPRKSCGGKRASTGSTLTGNTRDDQTNTQKAKDIRVQQLIDLVLTSKRNAENEVRREQGEGMLKTPGRKRRLEQETAERTLKYLRASQGAGSHDKVPVEGSQVPAFPGTLASVIGSMGLKDVDLREDGSELAGKLLRLLTGLFNAAKGTPGQSPGEMQEEELRESSPFDRLAAKLGLPTNCDIDLRKQEELEEQTAGSISSLEGFSPSSHSGDTNHHGAAGRGGGGLGRRVGGYEEDEVEREIPWVLIPISGLCSKRYTQRDRNIPQDPRFKRFTTATGITTLTKTHRKSPAQSLEPSPTSSPGACPSPEPSPPHSPFQCPSPDPSPPCLPSQSPSPELSPHFSLSQCPSPEPSPLRSLSQCPSPQPSPPNSPSQCPSPQPSPPASSSRCPSPQLSPPPSLSQCHLLGPKEHILLNKGKVHLVGANKEYSAPTAPRGFAGVSKERQEKHQGREKKNEEQFDLTSTKPSIPSAPKRGTNSSPLSKQSKEDGKGEVMEFGAQRLQERKETKEDHQREDVAGGPVFSPSISSPPSCPLTDIDSVVDKHLSDFSSDIQLLLRDESVHYSCPESPHSTSNTGNLPHSSISQFSQYVSFYNPCPPVQDYMSSLQESINGMLMEFSEDWPNHNVGTGLTEAKTALASSVSAFVASIRAANTKTDKEDDSSAACGEATAADATASTSQAPALPGGGEVWQPDAITRQFPEDTDSRNPSASHVTLSVPTSPSGSVYEPTDTSVNNLLTQQGQSLDVNRTVTCTVRLTQDNSTTRTVYFTAGAEGMGSPAGSNSDLTPPALCRVSEPLAEPSHPPKLVSDSACVSIPAPPATALSSLISQLQPEVFNSLEEIIKDVKKNSLQFYIHSSGPVDQAHEDIKEHLLKQGNKELNPVSFLSQESSDNRLLVIIKNKDIAAHIHEIPSLVSLKRQPSVVFVGIDTLDDIRNNSYNELFVSGGCIVSHESILNPDFITQGRLAALLTLLEQQSSPESVWKWKVHCKTHKKLKEQARFRKDAAHILDLVSTYHRRQIVELLPYHHCDMNHQSPDLNCLIELQARYTHYRHIIFLTDRCFETFPTYSRSGIVVAGIEEILQSFTRLVGNFNVKDKQPIVDDLLATRGEQPPMLLQQPGSGLVPFPHLSDQLVPDASCKDSMPQPSDAALEVLRMAISQFRAHRQAQLKQEQQSDFQAMASTAPFICLPSPAHTEGGLVPPPGHGALLESFQLHPDRIAAPATLEIIHSGLQPEQVEEPPTASGGGPAGESGLHIPSSNPSVAAVTGSCDQTDQRGEPAACPTDGDRPREAQSAQEQLIRGEAAAPGNSAAVTGGVTTVTGHNKPNPAQPRLHLLPLPQQQHLQQLHNPLQSPTLPQPAAHGEQQRWRGVGLLQPPILPRPPRQHLMVAPMFRPLTGLGGTNGLLGPPPAWPGGLGPTLWGHQPAGPSLFEGYHNTAGQGHTRYPGGQRGDYHGR